MKNILSQNFVIFVNSLSKVINRKTGIFLLIMVSSIFITCSSVSIKGIPEENLLSGTSILTSDVKKYWGLASEGWDNNTQKINLTYKNLKINGSVIAQKKVNIRENNISRYSNTTEEIIKHTFQIGSNSVYSEVSYQINTLLSYNRDSVTIDENSYYNRIIKINNKEIKGTYEVKRLPKCIDVGCYSNIGYEKIDYNINGKNISGTIEHVSDSEDTVYDLKYGNVKITGTVKVKDKLFGSAIFFFDFQFGDKKINGAYGSSEDIPKEPNIAFNAENLTEEELMIFMIFIFNATDFSVMRQS